MEHSISSKPVENMERSSSSLRLRKFMVRVSLSLCQKLIHLMLSHLTPLQKSQVIGSVSPISTPTAWTSPSSETSIPSDLIKTMAGKVNRTELLLESLQKQLYEVSQLEYMELVNKDGTIFMSPMPLRDTKSLHDTPVC